MCRQHRYSSSSLDEADEDPQPEGEAPSKRKSRGSRNGNSKKRRKLRIVDDDDDDEEEDEETRGEENEVGGRTPGRGTAIERGRWGTPERGTATNQHLSGSGGLLYHGGLGIQ